MAEAGERRGWLNPALVFAAALIVRALTWAMIPVDWNWDSYHHWQISYLSLRVGFAQGRLWDLNGCEYYWGMVPHLLEAGLMGLLGTTSITPYRALNAVLGSLNAALVYSAGKRFFSVRAGLYAGLLFALFPVAAVFDILAMQDTLALTFVLASLCLVNERPFWSGLALALAGQSRAEFLAAGLLILAGYCLRERLSTGSLPYVMGWALGTVAFSAHLFTQTGNPFYHLYVGLLGVFGGFDPANEGRPFLELAASWAAWKLSVWPTKPAGILIIAAAAAALLIIPYMAWRRWPSYQPQLYFLAITALQLPIFVTYLGSDHESLLIMLRMATPAAALGYPLLVQASKGVFALARREDAAIRPEHLLLAASLLSFAYFIPAYQGFQAHALDAYASADATAAQYRGGVIVCDHPTMNYRLVEAGVVGEGGLVGNHYSPDYYGVAEPRAYLEWLRDSGATLWVRYDYRSDAVWGVVQVSFPQVLRLVAETPCAQVYAVDRAEVEAALGRGNT